LNYNSGPVNVYVGMQFAINNVKPVMPVNQPAPFQSPGGTVMPNSPTPNPVASFSGLAASFLFYLGTCENGVTIREVPEYEPVMNDLGGTRKPFDRLFQGSDALSIGVLTRWNEAVYQRISSIPNYLGNEGFELPGAIGTLMITEGWAYHVYLQFPYFAKALFANNAMMPGYHFPFSYLEGPIEQERGTRPNKRHLTFYHGRGYNPATGVFGLYDYNLSVVPALPPN
jgi:hypothetical protein